jgi:IS30 family transposase
MDDRSQEILDSLPQRPSRSRLAPYRELIHELRRRRWSFREIAQVLAEKCQCRVSISTLHDFVRTHSRPKREAAEQPRAVANRPMKPGETKEPALESAVNLTSQCRSLNDDMKRRITALKGRPAQSATDVQAFRYNPSEPLRLPQNGKDRDPQ